MYSGWGVRFFDFDNDGDLDLILANGHPDDLIETVQSGIHWKEPLLLLENRGGKFVNLDAAAAGEPFQQTYTARGLAVVDLDNDGWLDVVVGNNGDRPVVLHNRRGKNHWIGLEGVPPGAVIRWSGGKRFVPSGGSYLSSQDPRVVIGLGPGTKVEWIEIVPAGSGGRTRRLENLSAGRYYCASILPSSPASGCAVPSTPLARQAAAAR
jgi:hypothetical protein